MMVVSDREPGSTRPIDPLHSTSAPGIHWTRANVGEAMPGVQTPLSWTVWASAVEPASREALFAIGALSRHERRMPARLEDRAIRIFFGRPAIRVDFLSRIGDRMPGTNGEATARAVLGEVPSDLEFRPTRRRYPAVACRLPRAFAATPARVRRFARETDDWYAARLAAVPALDRQAAAAMFEEATDRFRRAVTLQILTLFSAVQPLYESLEGLVSRAGTGEVAALSGVGGAEATVVADIWRAAHEEITIEQVVGDHGFHGPLEGELSARVWREDHSPLRGLLASYGVRDDPRSADRRALLESMQREVIAAFPTLERPAVWSLLKLAARTIPLRGVVKRSFLQCFDVARACARRYGAHLARGGLAAEPDDVFFLTVAEIGDGGGQRDVRALVAQRRARHTECVGLDLPASWVGMPVPESDLGLAVADRVMGAGVSAGVVEGVATVVSDPTFAGVADDTILVATTTDPSWSSIMYVSRGLVVDIGGAMSHAAVVAREMGIPCVVGTRTATRAISTGDRIRVDGGSGLVEILERAS
jgi:rifampicin phosphotransferase